MTPSKPPSGAPPGVPSAPTEEGPPGSTHPFHVRVDADLEDLVPGYLDNKRKDVERIREGLERSDLAALSVLGHSIAGSGGTYGFPGLTRIGRLIEHAAKAGDLEAVRQAMGELESYLRRVVVEYT